MAALNRPATASQAGLLICHTCRLVVQAVPVPAGARLRCPRCDTALHRRKPDSLARTWALTLTAYILYIPANALPVMTVVMSGRGEPDTILSGVQALIEAGMWPLALIVFFASITVPVLKLLVLTGLLLSVQRGSRWRPRERTVLYRLTEGVGRWSMIDVFVISILAALVQLGQLATIEAGPGAVAFSLVVVLTMFAALSFDPRLIWDALDSPPASHEH